LQSVPPLLPAKATSSPTPSGSNALRASYTGRNIDVLNRGGVRQAKQTEEGKPTFPGHIQIKDQWLRSYSGRKKNDI
jgi:hypothetical protein